MSINHWKFPRSRLASIIASSLLFAGCTTDDPETAAEDLTFIDDGELIAQAPQPSLPSAEVEASLEANAAAAAACTISVSTPKQLMITDLSVVNDTVRTRWTGSLTNPADGAWHFGRLMTQMAGANDPEAFVRGWLAQWQSNVTVNGQVVLARPDMTTLIINAWPKTAAGKLDLTKAPMRLLAIVNRFDLRTPGNAGEGRFVFGVLSNGGSLPFTVILEYKMPAATAADVKVWANLWKDLGTAVLGSATYRTKLQAITDRFAKRNAAPGRVNGSAISQVRTNENALNKIWELREFHLTTTGQLRMAPVAQTPAHDTLRETDNTARLATFMTQNATAIKAQTHVLPLTFANLPFAGAHVLNNIDFWQAPGITDSTLRHRFSLNTCNGCHGAETATGFLHIQPRQPTQPAVLSGFLTGITVNDPITNAPRTFNALASRNALLKAFLCANP